MCLYAAVLLRFPFHGLLGVGEGFYEGGERFGQQSGCKRKSDDDQMTEIGK